MSEKVTKLTEADSKRGIVWQEPGEVSPAAYEAFGITPPEPSPEAPQPESPSPEQGGAS
jgi:hypothetical protein